MSWNYAAQAGLELEILTLTSHLPAPDLLCFLFIYMPYFLPLSALPARAPGSSVHSPSNQWFSKQASRCRIWVLGAWSRCGCTPSALRSHSTVTVVYLNSVNPLQQHHWRVTDTWSKSAWSKGFCLFLDTPEYHLVPELSDFIHSPWGWSFSWNMLCGVAMREQNLCIYLVSIEPHNCMNHTIWKLESIVNWSNE